MSAPLRGALFAVALVAIFAVASLAGAAIDPSVEEPEAEHGGAAMETHAEDAEHGGAAAAVPGLAAADGGLRMAPVRTRYSAGEAELSFRILDADGAPVRDFDVEHERRMHLIVVRRDFGGFQHLHPRMAPDGTWSASADFATGGVYRAFADFSADGSGHTLGTDLFVDGGFRPAKLPPVAATADAGDGYAVEVDAADAHAGEVSPVSFAVTRDGRRIDGVEPYLGADGHLVALREHDLAFLHTHPEGEPGGAGPISFGVEYPSAGRYRLFLQFKHAGEIRAAEFTQEVELDGSHEEEGS